MTYSFANDAEGGTNGVAVTVANSGGGSGDAFGEIEKGSSSNTLTFSTAQAYDGTKSYKLTCPVEQDVQFNLPTPAGTAPTCMRLRFYFRMRNYPSKSIQFIQVSVGSGTVIGYVILESSGKLHVNDNLDNTVLTTTNGLPLNTWLRIETVWAPGTTTSNGTVRLGYAIGDGALLETKAKTNANLGTNRSMRHFNFGKVGDSGTWTEAYFDEIAADDGPSSSFIGAANLSQLYVGDTSARSLYVGTSTPSALYVGTTQIWP